MRLTSYIKALRGRRLAYAIGGAVLVLIVIVLGLNMLARTAPSTAESTEDSHVKVESVASLSAAAGPLEITGTVTSESQASILAQTSGEIVTLSRSLGDYVSAGSVIAQFENSAQRAAVTQAQGAYNGAQAALAKAQGTNAANSSVSSGQAQTAAANAASAGAAAMTSAYAALDDAVHTKADQLFSNPRSSSPALILNVPDVVLSNSVVNTRAGLEATLATARRLSLNASADNLDQNASEMAANIGVVESFLTDLINAVNKVQPSAAVSASELAAYQGTLSAARGEVVGALSSVQGAKAAYDNALAGATTAAANASGGTENDIKAAQANALSAQGSLAAAESALEKTIVRSPISGTIVSLPITRGDYVSAFTPVATVSNPGALYVEAQVTPADAATLAIGNGALIDGTVKGTVTFIAPAIDPSTGKIQVKVGITADASSLTDGEVTTLSLDRRPSAQVASANIPNTIPIIAIKIAPTGPQVFTVTASSTLEAHPVTLGTILGDRVQVSGIDPALVIVTDARGLAEGEAVVITATSSPS